MSKNWKKIISWAIVAFLAFSALLPVSKAAAAEEFEMINHDGPSTLNRSTVEIREGQRIQVQFHVKENIRKIGVKIGNKSLKKVVELSVYPWDRNMRDTMKGQPILTKLMKEWQKNDVMYIEFDSLPGGVLPAGEYAYVLTLKEGSSVSFTWYKPAQKGVCGFVNDFIEYGCPDGVIVPENPTEDLYDFYSIQKDFPLNSPPPESVISQDSPIAQMGVDSTKWSFVDGLGRTGTKYREAGNKNEKKVGIFYWTWHNNFSNNKPVNVTRILDEYPEAINDYNHPIWKTNNVGAYFWNEPIFGYYTEMDDYVLRKHAELLADAGVDFVLFDCTNGDYTWEPEYLNLLRVWSKAREDGVKTPQVGFMMNFGPQETTASSLRQIYNAIYKDGKYQDLWFYWEGKPLVMAYQSALDTSFDMEAEIAEFFTFRAGVASYFEDDKSDDYWGWLHINPQALYKNEDGSVEMTTVGCAQNANYETMSCDSMNNAHNMGRSYTRDPEYSYTYTYRGKEIVCKTGMENSKFYGLNFQEQWDYAIAQDPEIIFITSWNEWIAGRNEKWGSAENGFPDQCNDENSRDAEPSTGEMKDYYYYQMVSNIRRFKGMSVPDAQTREKTVDIAGSVSQWEDPNLVSYPHYTKSTWERDADGWGDLHYTGDAVRNDVVNAKVSYDKENLYFYAETAENLTPYTDPQWMRLLLDTMVAEEDSKDWEEFEFIVGRETGTANTLTLEKSTGGWNWEKVCDVDYTVSGSVLQLKIPREALGLTGRNLSFNFKWADNNLQDGDIMTLYTDGEAAPGGRFCFSFSSVKTKEVRKGCGSLISCGVSGLVLLAAAGWILTKKRNER